MKFKVLAGSHMQGERTYAKGDIVEESRDLVELFGKTKFEKLPDATPATTPDPKSKAPGKTK